MRSIISDRLAHVLRVCNVVTVFTGAGISAESGIPTFRGDDGLWKKFKPEELARFDSFMKNPDLVWEWYRYRHEVLANAKPNAGHLALVDMEAIYSKVTIVTQNVDNLHQRAGSTIVHELHGNITRNYCIQCGKFQSIDYISSPVTVPRCVICGGLIRPDVVWFGEMLPEDEWNAAVAASRWADLFLCVGTSAVVQPAASIPVLAKQAGAYVVEINSNETDFSRHADEVLIGKAGEFLPMIASVKEKRISS